MVIQLPVEVDGGDDGSSWIGMIQCHVCALSWMMMDVIVEDDGAGAVFWFWEARYGERNRMGVFLSGLLVAREQRESVRNKGEGGLK